MVKSSRKRGKSPFLISEKSINICMESDTFRTWKRRFYNKPLLSSLILFALFLFGCLVDTVGYIFDFIQAGIFQAFGFVFHF